MSNTLPPSLGRKHWDTWFLNSSKSKARLKFMKLGMLSWSGINMSWLNFCPIWGRFGDILLTNQSFSQQVRWFRYGTSYLLGRNDIILHLLDSNFFPSVNIEQQESCVNFWHFSGFAWTFLYINWVFYAFVCIIQIWTTCTCSNAYKLVENSNMCPWFNA